MLRRPGLGRLKALDPKPEVIRYAREHPGALIHIDIKKLGRIDGVGHRITGDHHGQSRQRDTGWEYRHIARDDASRLAFTAMMPDEKQESAVAFLDAAVAWFKAHGVVTQRIMTDHGSACKSKAFAAAIAAQDLKHKRTRPYTPKTNGKAERSRSSRLFCRAGLCGWRPTSSERALGPVATRASRTGLTVIQGCLLEAADG